MSHLINGYFETHLGLTTEEAIRLHDEYYRDYGLAIKGLVRHHQIDPLEYNAVVDDALGLESIIQPNPQLRQLLQDIDHSKVRLWLFTNAYVNHARKVVQLLGVDDIFEGLTYCDYAKVPLMCKPQVEMFTEAMSAAGVEQRMACYIVGQKPRCFHESPYSVSNADLEG